MTNGFKSIVKVTQYLIVVLVVGVTPPAVHAGDDVNETRRIARAGTVRIHSVRGDIKIVGWDRAAARVVGEMDDLAERL